ncbi:MAG: TOMM precursor leader peptide-binding protein [Oscillatoriaceae cyanobacterium]
MLEIPKFKSCYHVEIVPPEGVFFLTEKDSWLVQGDIYQQIAALIDGQRHVDEIVDKLAEKLSPLEVYAALMQMEEKGYIVESHDALPSVLADFCDDVKIERAAAATRWRGTKVAVTSLGNVATKPLLNILDNLQITTDTDGDLKVVLTDDYLQNGLEEFNQKALQTESPWMLLKPVGTVIWIGPIFVPGKTGCWECLRHRLQGNRPVESFIQKRQKISAPFPTSRANFPPRVQGAISWAATEITKWILQGENQQLEGIIVTLDTQVLALQNHILVKRPQCPCCGHPEYLSPRKPLPVVLSTQPKTFTTDGGHRCFSPEETLKKYQHHISPITGVVRSLQPIAPGGNSLTPLYIAGHNFAALSDDLYFLRQNVRGRSGGKGKTDAQAKASGLGEAIERYSGIFQGYEIREKGIYHKMGDTAIHPNLCMNFSAQQYDTRTEWNQQCPMNLRVPEPFDEEREIDWTPLWSLTYQDWKFLPTAYCYYGYPQEQKPFCWADSNGTAAGNTIEEAILQAFMELVERDSACLWWYNRLQRPAVNLESFDAPYFLALQDYYQQLNRDLWVIDITSDLGVPTFAAISRRNDRKIEDIIFGLGAHFDPNIAILRALTEVNQSLPAVASMATDGSTRYPDTEPADIDWWQKATVENQPYLMPDRTVAAKSRPDYPALARDDLKQDVITCVEIAQQNGLEMLVLDQTRPDIGMKVAKVVVPGLRHFWKRLAPGRLYDVPVKMGWLPEPIAESALNPLPIYS